MKSKISKIFSLIACVFILHATFSQEYSISNIRRYKMRNTGTIVDKNIIKGYFLFYELEKVDKQNRAFDMLVLDENLKEKFVKKIVEPKLTHLLEASYNGNEILFKFYDAKAAMVSYRTLNSEGVLSEKTTRVANKWEISLYDNSISKELENFNLNPFGENFVDIFAYKESRGISYKVECVDKNGQSLWNFSPDHVKGVDNATFLIANSEKMVLMVENAKSTLSRDFSFGIIVINKDGKLDFEYAMENAKYNMLPHNAYFDNKTGNLVVVGEYYDTRDKSMKAESLGIFVKTFDGSGNPDKESFISWEVDVYNLVDKPFKKEIKNYYVYFHNIVQTSDGRIMAVGEQYRKQVSAGGIALKMALGSNNTDASSLEIKIGNMILIELSADYKLSNATVVEKRPNKIILNQDYMYVNQHILAKMLKADGSFDYCYTQNNEDNSEVTICYIDNEKVEGKAGRRAVFNSMYYNTSDTADLKSNKLVLETDATDFGVNPGKDGYVMITEYYRKTKTMKFSLVAIKK